MKHLTPHTEEWFSAIALIDPEMAVATKEILKLSGRVHVCGGTYQFYQLAIGARFDFRGEQFTKTAMGMAQGLDRTGNIFPAGAEVTPVGEVGLLPPEEAGRHKTIPRWPYRPD